jgi:hypothetical protein
LRENCYLFEVKNNLPRILSLIDNDPTSKSYGLGDRYFWAWGLTDFGNATFQGCAHGLSRLWVSGLWPYDSSEDSFVKRIQSIFAGTKFLTRKDGSLEEAFPNEGSYCVTALVAFDLLVTIDLLSEKINDVQRQEFIEIVRPLIIYLKKSDETHAIISNHLATAVAALSRWDILVGDLNAFKKAEHLLDRILNNQSKEGWFMEYEGADPGYQTLCLHYLVDVHLQRRDLDLLEPIRRSIKFLQYFAHPDGSFGGHYGSRCTKFYYPSGILALAQEIPEALSLHQYMQNSISENMVVGLSSVDEPNLIPMFNSYAWSATLAKAKQATADEKNSENLPSERKEPFRKNFNEAGILIERGHDHYSIINYKKGGVVYHFNQKKLKILDSGVVIRSPSGTLGSNHFFDQNQTLTINDNRVLIKHRISAMPKKLTSPLKFLVLRIFCFTVFRSSRIREFTKRLLVKYLITKPKPWPIWNVREIILGGNLKIIDQCDLKVGYNKLVVKDPFVPIHMASQGYWQIQDEKA